MEYEFKALNWCMDLKKTCNWNVKQIVVKFKMFVIQFSSTEFCFCAV